MWTRLPFLCSFAAIIQTAAWAQTNDAKSLLLRVRANVTDTVARLPKYMCSLTIERQQYTADPLHAKSCDGMSAQRTKGEWKPRPYETDRVRLDVAVAAANEIYSWVGEDRFDDRDLFDLVREGALQTGGFSGFLAAIFGGDAANFTYNGETEWDGRMLPEFGFQVSLEQSNYLFGNRHGKHILTGYEGDFLADPTTSDLLRLLIRTNGDLAETGACESTTTLDYSRVRLNNSEFLLPREARLDILNTDGSELSNRTVYANCHEFLGESALKFDDSPPEAAASKPTSAKASTPSELALPAGLVFTLIFTEAIDTETSAAGDRIQAKLPSAIRDQESKAVLVPKGAEVTARIGRIERFSGPPSSVRMLVKLETVSVGGKLVPLVAIKTSVDEPAVAREAGRRGPHELRQRIPLGSFLSLVNSSLGLFEFRNVKPNFVIKSGLESTWTTAEPEHQRTSIP